MDLWQPTEVNEEQPRCRKYWSRVNIKHGVDAAAEGVCWFFAVFRKLSISCNGGPGSPAAGEGFISDTSKLDSSILHARTAERSAD